jgi:hypothetical protein
MAQIKISVITQNSVVTDSEVEIMAHQPLIRRSSLC